MKSQDDKCSPVTRLSFKKYLKLNMKLLGVVGLLPLSPDATTCDKVFDVMNILAITLMINIVVVPNVVTLFNGYIDVDIVMESLSGCTESAGVQIKYIILLLRRNELKQMIESCQDLWETNHPRGYEILLRYVKRGYLLTSAFLSVLILTATSFAILPYFLRSTAASNTLPVSPGIVINSTLTYEMVSCAQYVAIYTGGILIAAIDSLLPVLLIISCGQFELIRVMLGDINGMYEAIMCGNVTPNENFERFFDITMNECTGRHQRLLAHHAKIEEHFNLYCLVQMFIGLYTIALGLFNLSMSNADAYKYITILMTGITQILICSWSSERILEEVCSILTESHMTNLAVYNLPWYRGQRSSCANVSFLLMMTQHPVRLTVGKFTVLSMTTFSTVMTNAMSFLTVLRTLT